MRGNLGRTAHPKHAAGLKFEVVVVKVDKQTIQERFRKEGEAI